MDELESIIREIKSIAFYMSMQTEGAERKKEGTEIKMDDLSQKLKQVKTLFMKKEENEEKLAALPKEHFDIAIISIIDKEFEALDKVFKFKKIENQLVLSNGLRVWKSKFKQSINGNKELTLLFVKVGNAGNLSSFVVTDILLKTYNLDLLILCGIAAGNRTKAKIYSSVIGKRIIYYETQKLMPKEEVQYRMEPLSISSYLANEIEDIDIERWKRKFLEILKINRIFISEKTIAGQRWINSEWKKELNVFKGGIFAGEKLLADGKSSEQMIKKNQIGKDIFAIEMDGYGFAFACKQNDKSNWLVFRGISDFGGNEKSKPLNERFQIVAAFSAVALVHDYLENIYLPSTK